MVSHPPAPPAPRRGSVTITRRRPWQRDPSPSIPAGECLAPGGGHGHRGGTGERGTRTSGGSGRMCDPTWLWEGGRGAAVPPPSPPGGCDACECPGRGRTSPRRVGVPPVGGRMARPGGRPSLPGGVSVPGGQGHPLHLLLGIPEALGGVGSEAEPVLPPCIYPPKSRRAQAPADKAGAEEQGFPPPPQPRFVYLFFFALKRIKTKAPCSEKSPRRKQQTPPPPKKKPTCTSAPASRDNFFGGRPDCPWQGGTGTAGGPHCGC